MRNACWLVLLLIAALLPMRAHAALACTWPVGTMNFGTVNSPVPQTDNTPNPVLNCTGGGANATLNLCIAISAGSGGGGPPRLMKSGANTLQYQIYFDAAHTIVWGDNSGIGNSQKLALTLDGAGSGSVALPLYGRVFAQTVAVGTYTSSGLTATIVSKPGGSGCNSGSGSTVGTSTFGTQLIVSASCTISASTINFGTTASLASAVNGSGSLTVTCTNTAPYTIAMNAGTTTGNTIAARKLSLNGAGAGVVSYQLYRDSNTPPTTLWGDGVTGAVYTGTGTGSAQTVPVYAQVPAQATPISGTYKDTVTATITF